MRPLSTFLLNSALIILLVILFDSCARNPVTGKKEIMFMSESGEVNLGKEADVQVQQVFGVYENQEIKQFITKKGNEMAKISHRPDLDWTFRILDTDMVNAFAIPGGYVYFTRGILAYFNSEAEFAGVLGHEIGHITARHGAQQQTQQILAQGLFIGGLILSQDIRNNAEDLNQAMNLMFLKFSRDDESQSDELGVEYSTKIGYDAHQMANFFNTLSRMSKGTGAEEMPDFLSTHPNPLDRNKLVHALSDQWQKTLGQSHFDVERDAYLKMIDGIVYGKDPREGFFEGNMFYHPVLKIQFPVPAGWQTMNMTSAVQMANSDGSAGIIMQFAPEGTLLEAGQNFVAKNSLTLVDNQNVTVNGLQALRVTADQIDANDASNNARTLSYFIQDGTRIYHMYGISSTGTFSQHSGQFVSTMSAFQKLTDPDKLNRKPETIKVETVSASTTLSAALTSFGVPGNRLEEVAILNSMELTETVPAGKKIKVIEKMN